jgi:hypothetical protein
MIGGDKEKYMKQIAIEDLRPTQASHGRREVEKKTRDYAALTGHALEMAIAEKPVPIVLGPRGKAFVIDHHHVAAALWAAGIRKVPIVLVADLSSLDESQFWLTLENRRWTWPYDARRRRIEFGAMPRHVYELEDDPYRSIAGLVREAGGYEKTTVPLEEFRWTELFRATMAAPATDEDFDAAVHRGIEIAQSKLAIGLPGYLGKMTGS